MRLVYEKNWKTTGTMITDCSVMEWLKLFDFIQKQIHRHDCVSLEEVYEYMGVTNSMLRENGYDNMVELDEYGWYYMDPNDVMDIYDPVTTTYRVILPTPRPIIRSLDDPRRIRKDA